MAKKSDDLIEKVLIKIDERLDNVDKTLIKQEENLRHHMYRTEIAERRIEHIENNLEPIKGHISTVNGLGKLLMWLVGSGGLIALYKLLN